jgi:uncharacterized membrane protein YdjX (TVP38/TMEM64 family)
VTRILLLAVAFGTLFAATFAAAAALGYADSAVWQGWLDGVRASTGGRAAAAAAIVAMLVVDLVVPVPSSVVMTAAGALLGPWLGALVSFVGALAAACVGFWACRVGGRGVARRLVGEADLERTRGWFERWGVYAIVVSRPIPMLTEVLSCLAGLTSLPFRTFLAASALGTAPICVVYAIAGSRGSVTDPLPLVVVALAVPAVGWFVARRVKGRRADGGRE